MGRLALGTLAPNGCLTTQWYLRTVGVIPEKYRQAIRRELDALADGQHPEMATWVTEYLARLVRQPDLIWSHAESEVVERDSRAGDRHPRG